MTVPLLDAELVELGRILLELDDEDRDAYFDSLRDEDEIDLVQAAIAAAELEGADWREDPATMMVHLSAGEFRPWPYVRLLGRKFRDAVEGRSIRQIWNMPPRYGKSLIASRWGPAWALDRDPTYRMILVSYGDQLALENAVGVRDILQEHRRVLRAQLRPDRRAARRFVTTQGGGILAGGIASSITGFGAHGAIFDDPFKNWQEAHSAARRDLVDNAFRSVVTSRLDFEDSWVIVPMTRWHEDDISGRLVDRMQQGTGEEWELVRIPELAEEPQPDHHSLIYRLRDLLARKAGEPIEPERFPLAAITRKHLAAGTYLAAAMYQQRPAPEEGGEIKRAWFRLEDTMPPRYDQAISSWDMKLKDKESGDYVVGQAWGRTGKDLWMFDQLRGQWNQATTENAIALLAVRHPEIRVHYVENTGYGPEVMENLRAKRPGYQVSEDIAGQLGMTVEEREKVSALRQRGIGGIIPVVPKGDKSVRMRAVSPNIEAGDVHLDGSAQWLGIYLDEMAAFPNGAHDDQVDATSQALAKLTKPAATVKAATGTVPKAPVNTRGGGTMGVNAPAPQAQPSRARVRSSARAVIPRGVPRSGR